MNESIGTLEDEDGLYFGPLNRLASADTARDLHEIWFETVIVALVALHILAIVYYRLRGRYLIKPMITGRAALPAAAGPMRPGKWWVAAICLTVALGIVRWVIAGAPPFSPP